MKLATFSLCLFSLVLACLPALAQPARSPEVEKHMVEAHQAGVWLSEGNLAEMETALEPGFHELAILLGNYHPDQKTNNYLKDRGWGQLVWTQIMYRLMAIRNGVFDEELDFAERVALEGVALSSLETVEQSFDRLQILLETKVKLGLDREIDQFAQGFFPELEGENAYRTIITGFQVRFLERRDAVIARLESGEHPGIVDPAELPEGTRFQAVYLDHQERLEGENRLDEILNRLAEVDPRQMQALVETAIHDPDQAERENARNEIKLQLILVEDSLDASENDPSVARAIAQLNHWGLAAFDPPPPVYPDDFRNAMVLVYTARRNLVEQTRPDNLRDLYAIADLVR